MVVVSIEWLLVINWMIKKTFTNRIKWLVGNHQGSIHFKLVVFWVPGVGGGFCEMIFVGNFDGFRDTEDEAKLTWCNMFQMA